jgi:hypothetical protein
MPIKDRGPGTWVGVAIKLDFAANSRKEMTVVDHKMVNVEVLTYCVLYTSDFCRNLECGVHFSCYSATLHTLLSKVIRLIRPERCK